MEVNHSKQWTKDVGGDKWDKGYLVKETLPHKSTAGMQGLRSTYAVPCFTAVTCATPYLLHSTSTG